ncbi:hypothetical protein SERLA73DRAFT_91651 [Serpula lacrymans var. lacrymans S7.3]|uniref:Dipeptidyl-peptidase V n=2 Tax=Serpula lacrymans var. lacrymans TaxID=341189 RepID=F8PZK9_SERL3|nr:uncharacterized protein SERLADRAFT_470352 [Serpula lacrymans var. lacrymans S7.9]EGN98331.1 hypothetical protein SERLA73DRAFT_91651 [Serpula lacrymans var. lacrymans S7.3]EGO23897.1 hypothetical protein SERLADRAFT_470352 [Serpula lacrymans var. lacrymans S7.9]
MRLPHLLTFLGLSAQVPLRDPSLDTTAIMPAKPDFSFKEGADIFSPKDLIELARPGAGAANDAGDLVLVPVSKFSFEDKKNNKSIVVAPLESTAQPLEIVLPNGGDVFWLDSRTIARVTVVETEKDKDKKQEIYSHTLKFDTQGSSVGILSSEPPALIGSFPVTTAGNFRYNLPSGILVFSAYVYSDGDLSTVKAKDEAYENRGTTALVYDDTFERQWDTWVGPKHQSLFSVSLSKGSDQKWVLGDKFVNTLPAGHSAPVEPFGGTDDFDISETHIVYTTKDPNLPGAWHTKQNIFLVDFNGTKAVELTSGTYGATHAPVFNKQGDKVAWLQLDKDGYESDRAKVVIYDLTKNVRYTLTQNWDRSPDVLAFSESGDYLYFTAGDHARIKVFTLPVPPTPSESTTHPSFPSKYSTPVPLTDSRAASGVQILSNNRLVFTSSSLTTPNDVFIIRQLDRVEADISSQAANVYRGQLEQVTRFTADSLQGKNLSEGEEFWFKGGDDIDVQGWILKPKGWKAGDEKKWPILLLIHGGPQGAWEDQWSTRWNPNVFAQQGYFTVAINPTGSTTFGQNFTDAISENWGGKPFVDLRKGWQYVLDNYPEVDADRAVAAGASWGGYAINWIQGNPQFGFNFKALFCHDGVFDTNYNGYSTDELFFCNHEWGGKPWEEKSRALSLKYSPSNTVTNWSTPQLIVHGSKDYRLPETEGIAAFHALQQLGIPSRLVIFPDENHWVLNHGNSLKWHYEVLRWFDEYVGVKE